MSEKLTRITLPHQRHWIGLMEWGEVGLDDMIKRARRTAENLRAKADAIDAAVDAEFQIDVVLGPHAQRHVATVQKSSRHGQDT